MTLKFFACSFLCCTVFFLLSLITPALHCALKMCDFIVDLEVIHCTTLSFTWKHTVEVEMWSWRLVHMYFTEFLLGHCFLLLLLLDIFLFFTFTYFQWSSPDTKDFVSIPSKNLYRLVNGQLAVTTFNTRGKSFFFGTKKTFACRGGDE